MNTNLLIAPLCLAIGGGLGFFVGGKNETVSAPTDSSISARAVERSSRPAVTEETRTATSYDEISQLPGQTNRIQSLIELYSELEAHEFAQEAEKLDGLPFSERILASYLLFSAWAENSPVDAMMHAQTKMGFAGNFVKPTVLQSWAATDPAGAAVYFEQNPGEFSMMGMMGRRGGRGNNDSAAGLVAGEWAKQDPEAALAWAKTLKGRDAEKATANALKQLARTDPARAAEMIATVGEESRSSAYAEIAKEWAKTDWAKTESWIGTLPADQRESALASAVSSLALENPTLAADKVLTIDDDDRRDRAIRSMVGPLAKTDPSGAMNWAIQNTSDGGQRDVIREVMGPWVAQDRAGAYSWINSQPLGDIRDSAATSYIYNAPSGSASEKIALAETVGNDRSRNRVLGMAVGQLYLEDKTKGEAYLNNTDLLDDRTKERVRRRAGQ